MTPADYVTEIALPTVLELRDDRRSRRRAYLACIAVFHAKDHLQKAGVTSIEATMRAATGDGFDVVRGVCNGTKHVHTSGKHAIAFKAGADTDRPPTQWGEIMFGVSRWGDTTGGRDIRTSSGPVDLYKQASATLQAFVTTFSAHLGECDVSGL